MPIVFVTEIDPVGYGLIKSLSHPGRNVTGCIGGGPELGLKILSVLKEAMPCRFRLKQWQQGALDRQTVARELPKLVHLVLTQRLKYEVLSIAAW